MAVNAMIVHLEELLALHQGLLEISENKRQVLIKNQVSELAACVHKETRLMKQVSIKESQWRSAAAAFVARKGLRPEASTTVSDIIKLIDDEQQRRTIIRLQKELLDTIARIKEHNAINQQLIEQSLAFINYSLDLYTGEFAQDAVYQNPVQSGKQPPGRKSKAWFDTRA